VNNSIAIINQQLQSFEQLTINSLVLKKIYYNFEINIKKIQTRKKFIYYGGGLAILIINYFLTIC